MEEIDLDMYTLGSDSDLKSVVHASGELCVGRNMMHLKAETLKEWIRRLVSFVSSFQVLL